MNELPPLRPSQRQILEYEGGKMGIIAVPGSGKTWTLSLLAAEIIARGWLEAGQEVLVVTLVNSAVDNFYQRVRGFLNQSGMVLFNFRVRTLHGLAHDIVRERPDLVGMGESFQIIDERESQRILQEAALAWLRSHPDDLDDMLDASLDENKLAWVKRDQFPRMLSDIALSFVRTAKDLRLTPETLRERLAQLAVPLPLAEMGGEIYRDYQRALSYRGAVDFDDLIWYALQALDMDPALCQRLGERWPFILEDEAQDSSRLQEAILEMLSQDHGNWVRVGDPNQAIFETFTTANPQYLRDFCQRPEVVSRDLPNSGRSTHSIIRVANELVRWVGTEHPLVEVRDALQAPPYIEVTPAGDPQPNPPDQPEQVHLILEKYSPQDEMRAVVASAKRWLGEHPDETVAVLTSRNERGYEFVDALRQRGLPVMDSLLRSSSATRQTAKHLNRLLGYLANPDSARRLAEVYDDWCKRTDGSVPDVEVHTRELSLLRGCRQVEDYLWPAAGAGWLDAPQMAGEAPETVERLAGFAELVRRWQAAVCLPIDQLLITLGQDWFSNPADLALTHKLAVLLRQVNNTHPHWRLPELASELGVIANNQRRFIGFSDADSGFDPDQYKGQVLVATLHKAKGLEWDRVYLTSVNDYDFPAGNLDEQFIAEKWFLRDNLNLEAETLAQLQVGLKLDDEYDWYQVGRASQAARLDYIRERLRLLYVGITRARKELVITWNTGKDSRRQPALPLAHLASYWEAGQDDIGA